MALGRLSLVQSPQIRLSLFPSGQSRDIRVNELQVLQKGYEGAWTDVFDLKSITANSVEVADAEQTVIMTHNDSVSVSYNGIANSVWFDAAAILGVGKTFKGAVIELCAKSDEGIIIANICVARTDSTIRPESVTQLIQSYAGNNTELLRYMFVNQSTTNNLAFSKTNFDPVDIYIHYTSKIFYSEVI